MDSINSFIHLLDKIETQDRRLGMTIKNLRCLTGGKSMELTYAMAMKLAEESEKLTLLTRALPAYTGNPRALRDVDAVAAESVPIEAGFTIEGWFCIRLPLLLPKKERGSASYIRGILYPALRNFFQGKAPVRYPESIMIFRHVYEKAGRSVGTGIMTILRSIWSPIPSLCMCLRMTRRRAAIISTAARPPRRSVRRCMWFRHGIFPSGWCWSP